MTTTLTRFHRHKKGFTLLELLIASTIFSVILLGAGSALVQVSRMYYKGVITSRTQGTARTTIDDISRSIQFNGGTITDLPIQVANKPVPIFVQCVGSTRYTYALNVQVYDGLDDNEYDAEKRRMKHALWQDTIASDDCDGSAPNLTIAQPSPSGRELLGQYMRLNDFTVQEEEENLWRVGIGVVYGDNEVLNFPDDDVTHMPESCKGAVIGAQWCAVSKLTTSVYKRVQ